MRAVNGVTRPRSAPQCPLLPFHHTSLLTRWRRPRGQRLRGHRSGLGSAAASAGEMLRMQRREDFREGPAPRASALHLGCCHAASPGHHAAQEGSQTSALPLAPASPRAPVGLLSPGGPVKNDGTGTNRPGSRAGVAPSNSPEQPLCLGDWAGPGRARTCCPKKAPGGAG